jgi:hypothetical protein
VTRPNPSNYTQSNASADVRSQAVLPPVNNFYAKGKRKEDSSDLEGPDTHLQAGMESFPSRNAGNNAIAFKPTSKTAALTHGLGAAPKQPKPLFSANAAGALVMKKLDPEIERRLNKKGLPIVDIVLDPMLAGRMRAHQKE